MLAPTVKQTGGLSTKLGTYLERFDFSEDLQMLILYAGSRATVGSVVFGSLMAAIAAGLMAHAIVGLYPADLAGCDCRRLGALAAAQFSEEAAPE